MHIIWLTPEFPSNKSNTKGIYIYRNVKELAKFYKIHVICLYPASPPFLEMIKYWKDWKKIYTDWKENYSKISNNFEDSDNFKVIYLRYYRLPRGKFLHIEGWFAYLQAKKFLPQIITYDSIIHANWIFPAGTLASIISQKYKIPFIISLLGSDVNKLVQGSKTWKAAKKLLKQADKVTAVARDLFNKCTEKHIDIDPSKKDLIHNIYEADKFVIKDKKKTRKLLGISPDVKMIFYAGGLIPLKNVDVLIEAVEGILNSRTDVYLSIAGAGTDEGKLRRMTEQKLLKEKVFFIGNQLADGMVNYFNAADIFCLPSKSEGMPNVVIESFFCGTPVVASAVGGIPTVVKPGINGFLTKPNSTEDLQQQLIHALEHIWDRSKIRESVSHLFPDKVIENYHSLYNEAAQNFTRT